MKKTGKSENRGGARKGAGRKKLDISEVELNRLVKEFKKKAKETDRHIAEILADIAYGIEKVPVVLKDGTIVEVDPPLKLRLKAIEMYYDQAMVKQTHKTTEVVKAPQIYLPETEPKPKELEGEQLH